MNINWRATIKHKYGESDIELSKFFRALQHPARITIIEFFKKYKRCRSHRIFGILNLPQSTVSSHLKELKNIEIIKSERVGVGHIYTFNQSVWEKFQSLVKDFTDSEDH